ncbi:hypothetical protein GCM10027343_29060 [Noviherbaspirillum agri]
MKTKQLIIASLLSVVAAGAFADTTAVTRAQVKQELQNDFEIRQQLMQHQEVAMRAGCDLNAESYEASAHIACNNLVQKIAASNGNDAAAKVASFKAQNR